MTGRASGVARGPPGAPDGFGGAPGRCGSDGGTEGVERGIVGTDGCAAGGCGTTRPPAAGVGQAFGGSDDDGTDAEPIGVDRDVAAIDGAERAGTEVAGVATAIGLDWLVSWRDGANSSSIEAPAPIIITAPHTEHRARTPDDGIRVGSTRNTDRHSGQLTFTAPPSRPSSREASLRPPTRRPTHRFGDRWSTPIRGESSRSSSFQLPVRSPGRRA